MTKNDEMEARAGLEAVAAKFAKKEDFETLVYEEEGQIEADVRFYDTVFDEEKRSRLVKELEETGSFFEVEAFIPDDEDDTVVYSVYRAGGRAE